MDDMEVDEELTSPNYDSILPISVKTGFENRIINTVENIQENATISCNVVTNPAVLAVAGGVLLQEEQTRPGQVMYVLNSTTPQQQSNNSGNVTNDKPITVHGGISNSHAVQRYTIVNDVDIQVKEVPTNVNNRVVYYKDRTSKNAEISSPEGGTKEVNEQTDEDFVSHLENDPNVEKVIDKVHLRSSDDTNKYNTQTEKEPSSSFETNQVENEDECSISDNSDELTEHEEHTYALPYLNKWIDDAHISNLQDNPVPSTSNAPHTTTSQNTTDYPSGTHKNSETSYSNRESADKNAALDGWTKDEKYYLYMGIKLKGSRKVQEIKANLPNKTEQEIKAAINFYKDRANKHPDCAMRKLKVRRTKTKPLIPLATWAKVLTDNFSFKELQTDIASALRLIADLEDIPSPAYTERVDFRKAYHSVADAMEGKSIPENEFVTELINSCLLDTALYSKQFILLSAFKHIINSVNFKDKELPLFPRPTPDNELATIRHITALRNYNPLCIPSEHLKPISVNTVNAKPRQKSKKQ